MPRQPITFQRVAAELLAGGLRLPEHLRRELGRLLREGEPAALEKMTLEALAQLASAGEIAYDRRGLPPGQVRFHLPGGQSVVILAPGGTEAPVRGPRRHPAGTAWGEAPPTKSMQELIQLQETLLTGDQSSLRSPMELVRTLVERAPRILSADLVFWVPAPGDAPADWDSTFMARASAPHSAEEVFRDGSILVWDRPAASVEGVTWREGMRAVAMARVGRPGQPWSGVLEAWSSRPGAFTEARLALLEALAECMDLLLRQLLQLQRFVFLDPLTGLYNRAYYELQMRRELARAAREREPMALVLCDVDSFKSFNTEFGYAGGDAVLRGVAQNLRRAVRPFDSVARYGGEEFVVILSSPVNRDAARAIAERLRAAVGQARFEIAGLDRERRQVGVTISVGVALYPDDAEQESDLWRKANEAVLEAKAGGKNRVRFWGEPKEPRALT